MRGTDEYGTRTYLDRSCVDGDVVIDDDSRGSVGRNGSNDLRFFSLWLFLLFFLIFRLFFSTFLSTFFILLFLLVLVLLVLITFFLTLVVL